MVAKIIRPTSPGRRHQVRYQEKGLYKGDPYRPLTKGAKRGSGRNNLGRITVRHRGGGMKRRLRDVDFKRFDKDNIPAQVERIEYDPGRSANIALVLYADGERRYIVAPENLGVGATIISSSTEDVPVRPGNAVPLVNARLGSIMHCVELTPGRGAQLARSAGSYVQLLAREGELAMLRLRSGERRRVPVTSRATYGSVGNAEHSLTQLGKAGASRHRGIRPTVRGVAMNPVDHPHGGGEGKTSGGRHPVSPWGQPTKGFKTRKNKVSQKYIVAGRNSRGRGR